MSEHTPCIVCGLADHQSPDLPIKALRHALAWHIIYEGVTPKLLAALERMRRISPERLIGWRDAHAAEECGQLDCPYCYTDEAIKEAKGE